MTSELRRILLPLALLLWVPFAALGFAACGQPEDRTPKTGYTGTEEHMPEEFQGGAPGEIPDGGAKKDTAQEAREDANGVDGAG